MNANGARVKAPASLLAGVLRRVGLADAYWRVSSPAGDLFIAWTRHGISAVAPAAAAGSRFEREYRRRFGRPLALAATPPPRLARAVERRLAGERRGQLPLDLRGLSPFEQAVLRKALEIPRGEVRPYGWIAREIGRPRAVRAVGTALGGNPVPLLIPCHRVVRADGATGGYVFGTRMKRALLAHEGVDLAALDRLVGASLRFVGSGSTGIFCLPTCAGARRIAARHRVEFADERAALRAGFRPCKRCRPAPAS